MINNNIRSKIIVVDDNMASLNMIKNMLKNLYEVYPAPSAAKLFEILERIIPDLILMDIEMPEMSGYDAVKKMKTDAHLFDIPIIFLTARNDDVSEFEGLDLGAVDYISKPFFAPVLLKRISYHLLIAQQKKELVTNQIELKNYADNLEGKVQEKTKEVFDLQNAVLIAMADLVERRDNLTGGHIARTQLYLKALTDELIRGGIYSEDIKKWNMDFFLPSAPLHDVGKIAINDSILNKPGKLTPEEFAIMKTHVMAGVSAIEKIMHNTNKHAFLYHAILIAGTHHEKWDGTGYPMGVRGKSIALEGRLMAIADVYDALISVRPYKEALSHIEACKIIEESSGTHFDPVLVEVFKNVENEFKKIVNDIGN